jgi:hypothetical protein
VEDFVVDVEEVIVAALVEAGAEVIGAALVEAGAGAEDFAVDEEGEVVAEEAVELDKKSESLGMVSICEDAHFC